MFRINCELYDEHNRIVDKFDFFPLYFPDEIDRILTQKSSAHITIRLMHSYNNEVSRIVRGRWGDNMPKRIKFDIEKIIH